MSPSDDKDTRCKKIGTDSFNNPFVVFQRFVDEHMSSLLQSVIGLPSALKDPRNWTEEEAHDNKGNHVWRKEFHWPREKREDEQQVECGEDIVARFLNESDYSPFNLENDPDLKIFGHLWRQSFGDLIDASEGNCMMSSTRDLNRAEWVAHYVPRWAKIVEERKTDQNPLATMLDGFGSLTDTFEELRAMRKAFADEFKKEALARNSFDQDEVDEAARTELDMYERMLGLGSDDSSTSQSCPALSTPSHSQRPETSAPSQQTQEPSIVSTLTTSERITMPDGSVRTKRVLKKRFADGREESNESEEVQAPRNSPSKSLLENAGSRQSQGQGKEEQDNPKPEEKKKGGWFWS